MKRGTTTRGRPKTVEREQVIQTALMCYWENGPTGVAISEVCLKSGASKPGVYREFGSDDGLKRAVLEAYELMLVNPFCAILEKEQPFDKAVEVLIAFTVQDRQKVGLPDGCLLREMSMRRNEFGSLTREKMDQLRHKTFESYEGWIERAKARGQFNTNIPTNMAVLYCDAQNGSAMRLQKEGIANGLIREILRTAFSALR